MVSQSVCVQIVRRQFYAKSTLAVFALLAISEGLMHKPALIGLIPEPLNWVTLCALTIFVWALFYAAFGSVIWHGGVRNVPMIISGLAFCLFVGTLLFLFFFFLLGHMQPASVIVFELVDITVLMGVGWIVVLITSQDTLLKGLDTDSFKFPIWKPTNVMACGYPDNMPDALRQNVLYIQTSNQYIEVNTATGTYELRMSLTKAEAFLDDTIGTRVHRSHWVKNTEMKALTYKNGNPFIELHSGQSLPIGRNMVDAVKVIITAQSELSASGATNITSNTPKTPGSID
jgi:hypothetical protein